MFSELPHLGCDYYLAVGLPRIILEVFLMVLLGPVEDRERFELGDYGVIPNPSLRYFPHNVRRL
jgi:hypothetical protein